MPYPSEKQDRFMVRLPDGMRDQVNLAAKAAKRTMNAEIVARLEASFREGWLDRMQASPTIRAEKRLLSVEAQLESRIEALEVRVRELENRT